MVFFVSEFAYCALGTGPITVVQQVVRYFYFLLIPFGLPDATPFWFRLWYLRSMIMTLFVFIVTVIHDVTVMFRKWETR